MRETATSEALSVVTRGAPEPPGLLAEFWGYFVANRGAVAGLGVVVVVSLMAIFANVIAPYPPDLTNSAAFLKPPRGRTAARGHTCSARTPSAATYSPG